MTSLMMKVGKSLLSVLPNRCLISRRAADWGLAAGGGECNAEGEKFVCGLLLFPAEGAKQAINRSNLERTKRRVYIKNRKRL